MSKTRDKGAERSIAVAQARFTRQLLAVDHVRYLDVIDALWRTKELGKLKDLCLVEDHWLPEDEARWDPTRQVIAIRRDVYEEAREGNTRSRFTVAHELGHCWLGHEFVRNRSLGKEFGAQRESDEIAANAFAGELLAPIHLIRRLDIHTTSDVGRNFGVGPIAARQQLIELRRR